MQSFKNRMMFSEAVRIVNISQLLDSMAKVAMVQQGKRSAPSQCRVSFSKQAVGMPSIGV